MEKKFTVIIVEDAKLELKGTEEIFRTDIPEADIIGVASNEGELDELLESGVPDLLLLDLGLSGSTTVGVGICAKVKKKYPQMKVLIFTGELLNEKLWVDVLSAGADGITLKTGELLTKYEIYNVMAGNRNVFNQPILDKIASLKTMPFGVKSLEKRQADLVARLFAESEQRGINVTRLVVRAIELHIIDVENLEADE